MSIAQRYVKAAVARAISLVVLFGCSGSAGSGSRSQSPASAGSASQANAAGSGGATLPVGSGASAGATRGGSASSDGGVSQPCSGIGSTRDCCDGGKQTCGGNAEFPVWGPCLDSGGVTVVCKSSCKDAEFRDCDGGVDGGKPPPDAGKDSGQPMPDAGCGPGMECEPGAIRYCDDPAGEWTKSTCSADGMWGQCLVTTVPDGAVGLGDCSPVDYSPEMCCPQLFLCCQDNPFGAFKDWGIGACAAVTCP